jgi:hypothetical protein
MGYFPTSSIDEAAKRAGFRSRRGSARRAGVKILAVGFSLRLEEGGGTIEETEIERMLRPR